MVSVAGADSPPVPGVVFVSPPLGVAPLAVLSLASVLALIAALPLLLRALVAGLVLLFWGLVARLVLLLRGLSVGLILPLTLALTAIACARLTLPTLPALAFTRPRG